MAGTDDLVGSLCQAVKDGDNAGVMAALNDGADPNCQTKDWNKSRPIILAASSGHLDVIKTLLSRPSLNPNLTDELFGNTALIDASYAGNNEVVEELVADTRTDVNFRTERSGLTALMQAARYGHTKVVRTLVSKDPAGVNIQSQGGMTALMLACMAPHQAVLHDGEMIRILLEVPGVNLDIKDNQGKTAQQWARDKELFMIEKLILEKVNSSPGTGIEKVNTMDGLEIKIRELTEQLKLSEDSNLKLKNTVEELTERIKIQEEKISRMR